MSNKKKDKPEGNIYDRIFRENAKHLFIPLVEKILNIKIIAYQPLEVKFPKTSENEVDFLYKIEQADGIIQILHIEFQSMNDPEMLGRMQEYHGKIYKVYKLPIESLVINLGKKAFTARTRLNQDEIFTGYHLINLFELSTEDLLSAQIPEVVILALLANYPSNQIEAVLRLIVKKLKQIVTTEKDLKRYINQLLFLSRLRNFEVETEEVLNNMAITYDIETDGLYLKGVEKGRKQERIESLRKTVLFCDKIGMQAKEIAKEFDLTIEQVKEILEKYRSENR